MSIIENILATPIMWNLSQLVCGGNTQKQRLYRSLFDATGTLLDFGCANGNTFAAFGDFEYYGIDIDARFIEYARRKYRKHKNAHWVASDIRSGPFERGFFDYVLFAGTGHHIPDGMFEPVLQSLIDVVKKDGKIYFVDYVRQPGRDTLWAKTLIKFDQGKFTRTAEEYSEIMGRFGDQVVVVSQSTKKMRGNLFSLPDFYVAVVQKR
jgi:SAM-dependent methyltransferase